jgi:iron complex transport system permease protein
MGSFVDRSLPQAAAALVPAAIACALLARRSAALDLMALGEDVAAAAGHRPRRIGIEVVALSAIAVGACVSVAGVIAFVGLVAPFVARRLTGGRPGLALVPAAAVGAVLMLLADLIVRMAPAGRSIPVGVLTTAVGTPLFIWIVVGMRRRLAS